MPDDVIVDEANGLIRVKSVGDFPIEEWCKSMDKILALRKKAQDHLSSDRH